MFSLTHTRANRNLTDSDRTAINSNNHDQGINERFEIESDYE